MSLKVFCARKLPIDVENKIKDTFETIFSNTEYPLHEDEIIKFSEGVDAIICAPGDQIGADLISNMSSSVKMIATFSVGTDHIDLQACQEKGIIISNTPDVLTDATADLAMMLLLTASRRAFEGEEMVRKNHWEGWTPTQLMGQSPQGKTLGIVGMGRIGQALALRARAFGMEIAYYNRKQLTPELEAGAKYYENLDKLLKEVDMVSLHCPLKEETHQLINETRLSQMKKGAIIVNTARGPVIDDEALIKSLKSGHLAGAGLDVFDGEPNIHPEYKTLKNVTLLPHLGSATLETRNAMGFRVIENLTAFANGKDVPYRVI